jgi:hypothetical protein
LKEKKMQLLRQIEENKWTAQKYYVMLTAKMGKGACNMQSQQSKQEAELKVST